MKDRHKERVMYYGQTQITVRLCYHEDGAVAMLRFKWKDGKELVIKSDSFPEAPEKIYELLRECTLL